MILVTQSAYSQYPTTKRIKGDSVVIMRIGQADTINLLYKSYNDTINVLKDSLTNKVKYTNVLVTEVKYKEDSIMKTFNKVMALAIVAMMALR